MTKRDAATEAQVRAADPAGSVWLSANAGSGKTRVLTDRVARLLLNKVPPQNILCLTYTKAAASEMQNRLFDRLGEWAMLDEAKLREALTHLGEGARISSDKAAEARRLFASAIETPGGLKIQTIHSFCAALLRRFPLEAGVSPQFVEMDERAAKALRETVVEEIADGPNAELLGELAHHMSGDDLTDLTGEIVKHQGLFISPPDRDHLLATLQLTVGVDFHGLLKKISVSIQLADFRQLVSALAQGTANDQKAADRLQNIDPMGLRAVDLDVLEQVFLFGAGSKKSLPFSAKIGSFPTNKTRAGLADIMPGIENLMLAVEQVRRDRIALLSAEKALVLHRFAHQFLKHYRNRKAQHGWLDFDDLILKARALLSNPAVAQWVLFRLDGGIDHLLVDEAQDTSPAQWDVIERLTQEFTAGEGARDGIQRTVFVVGDKKQSIYSFQGADPGGFDRMSAHFESRLRQVDQPFAAMGLEYSFRSAAPILRLVDTVFNRPGETGLGGNVHHLAFKSQMPGRVDLWPVIPRTEHPEPGHWYDPVDQVAENKETVILANLIADQIAGMVGQVDLPGKADGPGGYQMRKVRAGDILILVQRRSELFHELIRACKIRNLPIAGADRLKIGAELAVRDISALLSFLATPEDDLSLATALRSPLFGWTQQELHALAQPRPKGQFLWAALRDQANRHPDTLNILNDLRRNADFLRPYDLIERALTRHGGRQKLLARLGSEAEDGIDAMMAQALAYERTDIPSLTGFLGWLSAGDVEIKRQLDSATDRIRVMTVHGAKGLEAPIVILPETIRAKTALRDEVLPGNGVAYWKTAAGMQPEPVADINTRLTAQRDAEQDRLLYVAMTRAEKWLIVAGAGDPDKNDRNWYNQVRAGMESAGAVPAEFPPGQGLRLSGGAWEGPGEAVAEPPNEPEQAIPDWAARSAPPVIPDRGLLSPSDLGGAKALPGADGLDEDAALRRGSMIHLLLEHLPNVARDDWRDVASRLLPRQFPDATDREVFSCLEEARQALLDPGCAEIFQDAALAEVELTASIPALGGRRILGTVDRLLVGPDRVLAVDFKTNAVVPDRPEDIPDGILRQMAAYYAALIQIYPDRAVEIAILWTKTAQVMPIPHKIVTTALDHVVVP